MSAAPGSRARLGALLLRKGLVSPVELEDALETQRTKGGLLGEILVRSGLASRPAIEDALAEQVGGRIEFEAGFGSGLRSQIASRRPRRGGPNTHLNARAHIQSVAVAPAPRPLLKAVPEPSEHEEPEQEAVVHELPVERHDPRDVPDLAAELLQQVERWQRLADDLREERDAVQRHPTAREQALAAAHEERRHEPKPALAAEHVLLARVGGRYRLDVFDGPPPEVGSTIELRGRTYLVLKVGPSPIAGDERPCAFAEPAA